MNYVHSEIEDEETVFIRIEDSTFLGLAADNFDVDFEDRGLKGNTVNIIELTLTPVMARALFLSLAESLTAEV